MKLYRYIGGGISALEGVGIEEASAMLAGLVPTKDAAQWKAWLYNNMKPSRRVSYRIPCGKLMGHITFAMPDIERVISIEKARAGLSELAPEDLEWLKQNASKKPASD